MYRLQAEFGSQPGDVAGGLDGVHGPGDRAVRVDDEGGPDNADGRLAVELLLPVGAVGRTGRVAGVGKQREGEALLVTEPGQLGRRVRGDADHRDAGPGQALQAVAEVARLLRAAGGHRGRV